jgi:DNA-directed RNA polymerase subunit L
MSIVEDIKIRRDDIDYSINEISNTLDEIMGIKNFRLPLAPEYVELYLNNINVSVFNAIRRTLCDEMIGNCLTFNHSDFVIDTTTDYFMADENFVRGRLRNIKLIPHLSKEEIKSIKFAINVINTSDEVKIIYAKDMLVTNGKLTRSLFNPTHQIAFLQPGKSLHINNIHIISGKGIHDSVFNNTCRNGGKPLDIEEYSDEEIRGANGSQRIKSGFKISTLVANPKKFRLNFYVPAVADNNGKTSILLIIDVCINIISRLQFILRNIEESQSGNQITDNIQFIKSDVISGGEPMKRYSVHVKNETDTIGALLARSIYNISPDISECVYSCIDHEKTMKLNIRNPVSDISELEYLVIKSLKTNIRIFGDIEKSLRQIIDKRGSK